MLRRRARLDGDRGAVAVEAALITPLLLFLLLGIIEVTMLLRDDIAVSASVRAGARTASAEPRTDGFTDDAAAQVTRAVASLDGAGLKAGELWVYKAGPNGEAPDACSVDCVRYTWDGSRFVRASGSWDPMTINACPMDAQHPDGPDAVGVMLRYRHFFVTGLFGTGVTLSDSSVLNFEPVPPTQGCA
ncbi:MAG TPA: TadE/TadG family type IV pilus assembly protein [Actinomycetes bacterium]|nr:TadE/TadG family type IV pilus assembly protein [Actinomycetes bacterium]